MPADCPPKEPFLELVTPQQALDDVRAFDAQVETFQNDVLREVYARLQGYDASGQLQYPNEWRQFEADWRAWRLGWQKYRDEHDTWLENWDGDNVVRYVELQKCELLDWRERLTKLGGKPSGSPPRFTQRSSGLSDLTTLALVGVGAYVVVNLVRARSNKG